MQKTVNFLTGSQFIGNYNQSLNCMEGFGRYTYPDGSVYRGFFQRGRFHGFGRLRLAAPYHFTFVGEFENGAIATIHELIYPDGLHMIATFSKKGMNFDNWRYCSRSDRRFTAEIALGLTPVSDETSLSQTRPVRANLPNTYDTEEGVYFNSTGFVTKIQPPFYRNRFISCNKEIEWIRKTCRPGSIQQEHYVPVEQDEKIIRHIINTNVNEAIKSGSALYPMTLIDEREVAKLCRKLYKATTGNEDSSEMSTDKKSQPSSESTTSFSDNSLVIDTSFMKIQETNTLTTAEVEQNKQQEQQETKSQTETQNKKEKLEI